MPIIPNLRTSVADVKLVGTLDGFTPVAGVITSADSILTAIEKLDGNVALKVDAAWLPGEPTNLPVPTSISVVDNANATRDIKLTWSAYSQGILRATHLLIYLKEIATPGDTILETDSSILVRISETKISFKGFNPEVTYKFGIAAVRSVDGNISVGTIVQPTAAPDWLVEASEINFTGKVGGTAAATVVYNASTALSNAAAAQATADIITQDVLDMSETDPDGNAKLTPSEKVTLLKDWEIIAEEKPLIEAQAVAYGITTKKTAYLNAFTALADMLNGGTAWVSGTPLWINPTNMPVKTPIVRTTFRATFKTYRNTKLSLLQQIADEAKAAAVAAQAAADLAASDASTAQADATAAKTELADFALDSKLSKTEKPLFLKDYNLILEKKTPTQTKAAEMGIAYIDTLSTAYGTAITDLTNYLVSLSPAYNDLTQSTTIVPATFKAAFNAVYLAEQALLNAMSVEAAKRALWATGIPDKPANLAELAGTESIKNTLITINANGTLSGAGSGSVTLGGLGATAFASLDKITSANVDSFLGLNAINSSYIANLSADKIAAGTLAAAVVYAGTINANQVVAANLAAINANLGTITSGHISGTAGIDISGVAVFHGLNTDTTEIAIDSALIAKNAGTGFINGAYCHVSGVNNTGYGLYGASWSAASTGGGVLGVSKSTTTGAGVRARNAAGGPALAVEGPMTIDNSTLVANLNAAKLGGYTSGDFAPIAHVGASGTGAHPAAVAGTSAGFMSAADKTKLDTVATGATNVTNTNQLTNGAGFTSKNVNETIDSIWTFTAQQAFNYPGAAPFTVASNINVTNLNADLLDGQHGSYYYPASNPNGYTTNTGTVTSVSGTAPIVSSGGATPAISLPAATSIANGYMTSTYAAKLDGIAAGATANTGTVTSVALSLPSFLSVSGSPVTSSGTLTATLASQLQNQVLAAPTAGNGTPSFRYLVANDLPSIPNTQITGLGTLATQNGTFSGTHSGTSSGTNTGDNAVNSLYSGLVSNATHTGDATGSTALTVVKINGTLMSGLATGILKNTTGTGVPSIAVAGDFPTLNQNTTGSAGSVSGTGVISTANLADAAVTAAKVSSGIVTNTGSAKVLGGTAGSPSNGTTRNSWLAITIGATVYYIPLYL